MCLANCPPWNHTVIDSDQRHIFANIRCLDGPLVDMRVAQIELLSLKRGRATEELRRQAIGFCEDMHREVVGKAVWQSPFTCADRRKTALTSFGKKIDLCEV